MKRPGKILIIGIVFFLLAAGSMFSDDIDFSSLQKSLGSFSEDMTRSLPFNSTMGLNWSDAYIGQFLAFPPNFGIGLTFGFTNISIGPINELINTFSDTPLPFDAFLPLPGYTLEGRIGGFVLPFDIGFKIGTLPDTIPLLEALTGAKLNYLLVGGDFRYALVNKPIFKFSLGLGYNYLNGGISIPVGSNFGPLTTPNGYSISMSKPEVGLLWDTHCLEFKAHASISTVVITPYAGIGMNYSWTRAGYNITSKLTMTDPDGQSVSSKEFLEELKNSNIAGIEFSDKGIESILRNSGFNIRAYGGFSLNMSVIRFDLTGMYDILNENFGLTVGIRFQAKSIFN